MSIEGHGIWEAAKARGIAHVPCVVVDHLDPNDLRLLRVALNRLGETGAWNVEALRLEFEELTVLGSDLLDTGFEMAEIDTLLLEDSLSGSHSALARNISWAISASFEGHSMHWRKKSPSQRVSSASVTQLWD